MIRSVSCVAEFKLTFESVEFIKPKPELHLFLIGGSLSMVGLNINTSPDGISRVSSYMLWFKLIFGLNVTFFILNSLPYIFLYIVLTICFLIGKEPTVNF